MKLVSLKINKTVVTVKPTTPTNPTIPTSPFIGIFVGVTIL